MTDNERVLCGLCGEPMPPGEEMFNYHGYSGPCPKKAGDATPPAPSNQPCKCSHAEGAHDDMNGCRHRDRDGFSCPCEHRIDPPAPPAEPPMKLNEAERDELDDILAAICLPGFTERERQIARATANLAFEHARAFTHPPAVAGEDARLANVFLVTEYRGGGVRGVFKSKAAAEAEIAAICGEHPNLTRSDFVVQVERIRPFPTWGRGTTPTPGAQ